MRKPRLAATCRPGLVTGLIAGLIVFIIQCLIPSALARTWLVGPEFYLKTPGEAIRQARNGDTIKIIAGTYENDTATIDQNDLTIIGVNGFAHLKSSAPIANGKAIWVTRGRNITLRNIEFSGARVRDRNGAGIRLEHGSLTLDNCYFHHNEMGLLSSNDPNIRAVIKNSEFSSNQQDYPATGKLSHNIYLGAIAEFQMENSISRAAHYGHTVKSRARKTTLINNRIFDEGDISASYLVDLPNGGLVLIENNYFYRNGGAQNNAVISYGAEGMQYAENALTVKFNNAINDGGVMFLLKNHSDITAALTHNRMTGLTAEEIPGIEKDGFWDRMKRKIRDNLGQAQ